MERTREQNRECRRKVEEEGSEGRKRRSGEREGNERRLLESECEPLSPIENALRNREKERRRQIRSVWGLLIRMAQREIRAMRMQGSDMVMGSKG